MKIGVSVFQQRISPRLDRCREVRVFDIGNGAPYPPACNGSIFWKDETISERAQALQDRGVHGLVCGAAEPWMEEQFRSRGIRLYSWVSGSLEEVLEALTQGNPLPLTLKSAPDNP